MKRILKLIIGLVILFFVVKLCTSNLGSVIQLPGGMGGSSSGTEGSGGWFSPKESSGGSSVEDISSDLEKELGIGKEGNNSSRTTVNIPSTTTDSATPLAFKGIPITGTLSAFGNELAKAGFSNAGNGTYTGNFAGYDRCKVTPIGNNPVREVRVDFPVISEWDSLEESYDSLKASLTQKYGIEPKELSDSNVATYNLPNGAIILDADVKNPASWHVILRYVNGASAGNVLPGRNPMDDL